MIGAEAQHKANQLIVQINRIVRYLNKQKVEDPDNFGSEFTDGRTYQLTKLIPYIRELFELKKYERGCK